MTPERAIGELQSPQAEARRNAADALRTPSGVPPEAVAPLLGALSAEQDPGARGAELIALGRSGASQAKPAIDQAVMTAADPNMRRWAARALKYWMIQTGQLPAEYAFPDGWPYGQPGYPPPMAK
jgi:HEAT repeat protein